MRHSSAYRHGWDDYAESSAPGKAVLADKFMRRPVLRAAVFGRGISQPGTAQSGARHHVVASDRVITGKVADVSPHVLILHTARGEERVTLAPDTKTWRGGPIPAAAIRQGDQVIVRKTRRPETAERVWAQIGRVSGIIIESHASELLVDVGPARKRQIVVIEAGSLRRVQVRFPRISPGYLIDVIGLRRPGYLLALTPATAQPPYRADHPPAPTLATGHVPKRVSGTAVWHEPAGEPPDLRGVAYPALDPETNCEMAGGSRESRDPHRDSQRDMHEAHEAYAVDPHSVGYGCVLLPYLSVGSAVHLHNECSDTGTVYPVTSCGASARLFCDRCVECGTSPRGRIADLTMTAFAELGGNLDDGCFNATLTVPG